MSNFTEQPKGYLQYDYIEEDSDPEMRGRDSSDDELDILLHGTLQQKRRLTRSLSRGSLEMSSSEDEFEREMEKELDETMRKHESQFSRAAEMAASGQASGSGVTPRANTQDDGQAAKTDRPKEEDFYNDIYFDSDDETEERVATSHPGTSKQSKKSPGKRRVLTNDELLYDPDIDDKNQEWVNRQRKLYYPSRASRGATGSEPSSSGADNSRSSSSGTSGEAQKEKCGETATETEPDPDIPRSDAVLNCPACMTTLCLDCQRHELYPHQYRAMFVLNCTVVRTERLAYTAPPTAGRKKWRKRQRKLQLERSEAAAAESTSTGGEKEYYYPVRCSTCNTEVAVYDNDEVFHFFNVLTSLS